MESNSQYILQPALYSVRKATVVPVVCTIYFAGSNLLVVHALNFFLFYLTSVGFRNVSDLRCSFCVRILIGKLASTASDELLSGFNLLLACGDCSNLVFVMC